MNLRSQNLYQLAEFLIESNAIEDVYTSAALADSIRAWNIFSTIGTINQGNILVLHSVLMQNLNLRIAGKIRKINVTVGGRLCPGPSELRPMLEDWVEVHAKADTEENIKKAHVAFEKIHPFEDGNGRTGRIIMNWQRVQAGLPLHIIHAGEEQQEYYTWFK